MFKRILSIFLTLVMVFSVTPAAIFATDNDVESQFETVYVPEEEDEQELIPFDEQYPEEFASGEFPYELDNILVKFKAGFSGKLSLKMKLVGIERLEYLFKTEDGIWYSAFLKKNKIITEVVEDLRLFDSIICVDYNYIYESALQYTEAEMNNGIDVAGRYDFHHPGDPGHWWNPTDNPMPGDNEQTPVVQDPDPFENTYANEQWGLTSCGVQEAWTWLANQNYRPGGDSNVIVAVIDTGVDYDHEDLKDNIWYNIKEIPNNGIDDDGNGYIDDYYGVNVVSGKGNGDDDQGHGTHVAGIIAAQNNKLGTVGVAYNTTIMPIKAGMSSGYFNQSSIAKAVLYAYDNGADVINMSFGGSQSSIAVQDALATAYKRCVLVASAGNNGLPNEYFPGYNGVIMPTYPAAYSYVLGVMSIDSTGRESEFSNYDGIAFSDVEYELYAPGSAIISTTPNNNYATWSGTSMAAPFVSGMAALLRSYYTDLNSYPTKFIYGQLSATSGLGASCYYPAIHGFHNIPEIVNLYDAFTKVPQPELGITDYVIFDDLGNSDGVIDAGETVTIGLTIRNRWGISKNTKVTIDAYTYRDGGLHDNYIQFANKENYALNHWGNEATVNYGSVGTYSTQDAGKVYTGDNNDVFSAWENPFYVKLSDDTPNDYIITINYLIECENGFPGVEAQSYQFDGQFNITVRSGKILPTEISEDLVLSKGAMYIIADSTVIKKGTKVTVEPGTKIQFWSDDPNDAYATRAIAMLTVEGELYVNGTEEEPVEMVPSDLMSNYRVEIDNKGTTKIKHANIVNPYLTNVDYLGGCELSQNYKSYIFYRYIESGQIKSTGGVGRIYTKGKVERCAFYKLGGNYNYSDGSNFEVYADCKECIFVDSAVKLDAAYEQKYMFTDCVFLGNNNYWDSKTLGYKSVSNNIGIENNSNYANVERIARNAKNGSTYLRISTSDYYQTEIMARLAEYVGGHLAVINDEEEYQFLFTNSMFGTIGLNTEKKWIDNTTFDQTFLTVNDIKEEEDYYYFNGSKVLSSGSYSSKYFIFEIEENIDVDQITLSDKVINIDTDEVYELEPVVTPITADASQLLYYSSDTTIATVTKSDNKVLVTPKAIGKALIVVFSPDMQRSAVLEVNVKSPVGANSVEIVEGNSQVNIGEKLAIHVNVYPKESTKTVSYESSDPSVAIINNNGVITGISEGYATITASVEGYSDNIIVHVVKPVQLIAFTDEIFLTTLCNADDKVEIPGYVIKPLDATNKNIIWQSSNPEIATVIKSDGVFYLVCETVGTATLRAKVENTDLYADVIVNVSEENMVSNVIDMTYANETVFALTDNGDVWYWGTHFNANSVPKRISFQYENTKIVPVQMLINSLYFVTNVETGSLGTYGSYICYILGSDGVVYCSDGLSPSASISSIVSVHRTSLERVIQLDGLSNYGLALSEDGEVFVWGSNSYGRLGTGDTTDLAQLTQTTQAGTSNITEKVIDIRLDNNTLYYLCEDGDLYVSGYYNGISNVTPTRIDTGIEKLLGFNAYKNGTYYNITYPSKPTYSEPGKEVYGLVGGYQDYPLRYYFENDHIYLKGNQNNYELGVFAENETRSTYVYEYKQSVIDNVVKVFQPIGTGTLYFATSNGKLYGSGNSSDNKLATYSNGGNISYPVRILLGLNYPDGKPYIKIDGESGSATAGNLTNVSYDANGNITAATLNEQMLQIGCNTTLFRGNRLGNLSLSVDDQFTGCVKEIELNNINISKVTGFVNGKTYTVSIPVDAFRTGLGAANSAINVTFTYAGPNLERDNNDNPNQLHTYAVEVEDNTARVYCTDNACDYSIVINDIEDLVDRSYASIESYNAKRDEFIDKGFYTSFYHNSIINRLIDEASIETKWLRFIAPTGSSERVYSLGGNYWGTTSAQLIKKQIVDYNTFSQLSDINEGEVLTSIPENAFPTVSDAYVLVGNEKKDTIGNETATFVVEFNRDMDVTQNLDVTFGSSYPYADYTISGNWVNARRWEGTTTLKTIIESGNEYWSINGGRSVADENGEHLKHYCDWGRFSFEIDTSSAMSMLLQAEPTNVGIQLSWTQDDYDTLAGYNVYRATSADGKMTKVNDVLIFPEDTGISGQTKGEYLDSQVEPGKKYYYTFTVVGTDLGAEESIPSGKIAVTAKDTMAPNVYHTQIVSAYTGTKLGVSATVTDNVSVSKVTLYYRTTGTDTWKSITMTANNDKYSAFIPADAVTINGIQYYIEASDGINSRYAGDKKADNPYSVTVIATVDDSHLGDVNGDGFITVADVLMMLQHHVNLIVLNDEQFARADLDGNDEVTLTEALRVLKYVNGQIGSLK